MATQTKIKTAKKFKFDKETAFETIGLVGISISDTIIIGVITAMMITIWNALGQNDAVLFMYVGMLFLYVRIAGKFESDLEQNETEERFVELENAIIERLDKIERNV